MVDSGVPAFPSGDGENAGSEHHVNGMSLREWFAGNIQLDAAGISVNQAQALMGEKAPDWSVDMDKNLECIKWWVEAEARYRYTLADAMLVIGRTGVR